MFGGMIWGERLKSREQGSGIRDQKNLPVLFGRDGESWVTKELAWGLAEDWVAAWNAHDLDRIVSHYEDEVELTSPVAARLLGVADGTVVGKENLRAYFKRGLAAYPQLRFKLEDVLWGLNSVVLYYTNQNGNRTAEFMELSAAGKVARVVAHYNG